MSSAPPHPHPRDPVIITALRTPLCRARKGALSDVNTCTLLSTTISSLLSQSPLSHDPSLIDDICIGNVLSPQTFAITARMAALSAGIPHTTSISVVNRQCSSGLQAVANIANAIRAGQINIGIGGGCESMSANKMHSLPAPEVEFGDMGEEAMDCMTPMGVTSENVAKRYGLQRRELDEFAAQSHRRAAAARSAGKFRDEIIPVGNVTEDDGIRPSTTADTLSRLKPVFDPQGSTTAGNASQMTDGAAAVLLMSREEAEKRQLTIRAVWRGYVTVGVPPKIMGVGPAVAIPRVLRQVGLTVADVDLFEINEAFATQALWSIRELGIDTQKVNVNGGAIALGHPLGCTGARQIATLLNEMDRTGGRFGVVSMCIGTGMGAAAVIELEQNYQRSKL